MKYKTEIINSSYNEVIINCNFSNSIFSLKLLIFMHLLNFDFSYELISIYFRGIIWRETMKSRLHKMNLFKEETRDVFLIYKIKFAENDYRKLPPPLLKTTLITKASVYLLNKKLFICWPKKSFSCCPVTTNHPFLSRSKLFSSLPLPPSYPLPTHIFSLWEGTF